MRTGDPSSPASTGGRPPNRPASVRLEFADIGLAIATGLATLHSLPRASVSYAAVFAIIGLALLTAVGAFGLSPLAIPFAGGFMLVGPILLCGYFELIRRSQRGRAAGLREAFGAFVAAPPALWMLALLCAFLFLIWITDAGILYSFTVGSARLPYDLAWLPAKGADVVVFEFAAAAMGALLAYLIFTVSAFSAPLIYERRAGLVDAVLASARTVIGNFRVCLVWGVLLAGVIMLSILAIPLLLLTLPVMAYASFALYRRAFPCMAQDDCRDMP